MSPHASRREFRAGRCESALLGCVAFVLVSAASGSARAETLWIDNLDLSVAKQTAGQTRPRKSMAGTPLTIQGKKYDHGFGTHSVGSLALALGGTATRFTATVGIDDETNGAGSAVVRIADENGTGLYESPRIIGNKAPLSIDFDMTGLHTVFLMTGDADDGGGGDDVDWADAKIEYSGGVPLTADAPAPVIATQYVDRIWIKVDDRTPGASYTGSWATYEGNPCYRRTEHYSRAVGAVADFYFVGTQARFYGFHRSDQGRAQIYLDGVSQTIISAGSADPEYDVMLFESPIVDYGPHTLSVQALSQAINVDAFAYRTPATPWDNGGPADAGGVVAVQAGGGKKSSCQSGAGPASTQGSFIFIVAGLAMARRRLRRASDRNPTHTPVC
jgi:hypothetical protein